MVLRSLCVLALLLTPLWLASCVPTGTKPVGDDKCPYYVDGRDRLAKQDYKGAKRAFEKSLEANPRSALAHYELGLLSEQHERDYAVAIYHYRRALELRPDLYPADNAKVRIRSCRQELAKEEALSPLDRGLTREMEQLRAENGQLRQQLEELKKQQASLPAGADERAAAGSGGAKASSSRTASVPVGRAGTHVVRKGETAYGLARAYGLSLTQLQAANPGVRLDKMVAGQVLKVPSR